MTDLQDYSMVPSENGTGVFATADPGFPEGMPQNKFNDAMRTFVASARSYYDAPEWLDFTAAFVVSRQSATVVRIAGVDLSVKLTPGRLIKVTEVARLFGSFNSSVFTAGNTDVTVTMDGAVVLPTPTSTIGVNAIESMRQGATYNVGNVIGLLPLNTQSAALGTAAYKDTGNTVGNIPLNTSAAALAAGAYKAVSNTIGDLAVHALTGPLKAFAYRAAENLTTAQMTSDTTYTASAEALAHSTFGNVSFPGTADGVKAYVLNVTLQVDNLSGAGVLNTSMFVHLGPLGTISDPIVLHVNDDIPPSGSRVLSITDWRVLDGPFGNNPASGQKLTIGFSGNRGATLFGTSPRLSFLRLRELMF